MARTLVQEKENKRQFRLFLIVQQKIRGRHGHQILMEYNTLKKGDKGWDRWKEGRKEGRIVRRKEGRIVRRIKGRKEGSEM